MRSIRNDCKRLGYVATNDFTYHEDQANENRCPQDSNGSVIGRWFLIILAMAVKIFNQICCGTITRMSEI